MTPHTLGRLLALAFTALIALTAPPAMADGGRAPQDARIEQEVTETLAVFSDLDGIEPSVKAGIVILNGEVPSTEKQEQAEALVQTIDEVRAVQNNLRVARTLDARLVPIANRLEERAYDLLAMLPLMAVALLVFALTWLLANVVRGWTGLYTRLSDNAFIQQITARIAWGTIVTLGALLALEILDATALVGGVLGAAGVVGIAVGFAFREMAENYIASIMLSLRQPFLPNDHVKIGEHEGLVTRLTTRSTILTTFDGNRLRLPNATVFKSPIMNYTRSPERRFDFSVGVGTDVDLVHAQCTGLDIIRGVDGVLADPEPFVLVNNLGDSTVQLRFHAWVNQGTHSFGKVRSLAIRLLKETFDDEEIDMPEPIYNVRLAQTEAIPTGHAPSRRSAPPSLDDTSVDRTIQHKAEQDRLEAGVDLLDHSSPQE